MPCEQPPPDSDSTSRSVLIWSDDAAVHPPPGNTPRLSRGRRAVSAFWPASPTGTFVGQTESRPSDRPAGQWRTVISASVYLFLVYLTVTMCLVQLPAMFIQQACLDLGVRLEDCTDRSASYDNAQKISMKYMATFQLLNGVLQTVTCSTYGMLGDAFGRKVPLVIPIIGLWLQALAFMLIPLDRHNTQKGICFLIGGLGGMYVTNAAANATVADVTQHASQKQKARMFGIVGAGNMLGVVMGPVLGGQAVAWLGTRNSFAMNLAIGCINLILLCFYMETLEPKRRASFSWRKANPFAGLAMFMESRFLVYLGLAFVCYLMANGAMIVLPMWMLKVADVTAFELGMLQSSSSAIGFVGLAAIFPFLTRTMSLNSVLILAFISTGVYWALIAFATAQWMFYLFSLANILGCGTFPIFRSMMASAFGPNRFGQSLAALGTVEQLVQMISPIFLETIYSLTVDKPMTILGAQVQPTFLATASFLVLGTVFTMFLGEAPKAADNKPAEILSNSISLVEG